MASLNATGAGRTVLLVAALAGLTSRCSALESWDRFSGGDAGSGAATIAFVQVGSSATDGASVSSVQLAYPSGQQAGDLNVVVVGWFDTGASIHEPVVDSSGNVYRLAAPPKLISGTPPAAQAIYLRARRVALSPSPGATAVTDEPADRAKCLADPAAAPLVRHVPAEGAWSPPPWWAQKGQS